MSTNRLLVTLSLAAVLGGSACLPASAGDGCETYGKLALQQQKDNQAHKCGLSGREWSANIKEHIDWCSGVTAQDWQAMLKKRTQALEACKQKS